MRNNRPGLPLHPYLISKKNQRIIGSKYTGGMSRWERSERVKKKSGLAVHYTSPFLPTSLSPRTFKGLLGLCFTRNDGPVSGELLAPLLISCWGD